MNKLHKALTNITFAASVAISAAEDVDAENAREIKRLRELLAAYLEQFDSDDSDITVKDWLDNSWIPAVRRELENAV